MISIYSAYGIQAAAAWLFMIVLAISVHEMAHAWMAYRLGDDTAARMGRVTINPVAHFDPIGFLCVVFAPIGWGRPVPYNPYNLKDPRRDGMWIAWAGPASNFIQAAVLALIFRILSFTPVYHALMSIEFLKPIIDSTALVCYLGVMLNLGLAFFNLIPLFPLDGEKILVGLLPFDKAIKLESFRQYGPSVLMGVLMISFALGIPILSPYFRMTAEPLMRLLLGM
ncbi:MAG: site-2 protease family protein [bacterium]|nr:site-2 protease family protein [bacterium]